MSICAIFWGTERWDDMLVFGESRKDWLSKYIDILPGIYCYRTFRRVFAAIAPSSWRALIEGTLGIAIKEGAPEDPVPIDGKT